ncbi:hypothetical protein GCM10009682_52060 [Luedemannella flava]|uniref:BON domain-containing protein n=1 Tax=Luedemannella flava TaxID=349316 RepID=A0ABN2MFY9_9ACTN
MQLDEYGEARVQRLLAEHDGVTEQGITVIRREGAVVLCGMVESTARRDDIVSLVSREFPEVTVVCDIQIAPARPPIEAEELS